MNQTNQHSRSLDARPHVACACPPSHKAMAVAPAGRWRCGADEPGQAAQAPVASDLAERIEAHVQRLVRRLEAITACAPANDDVRCPHWWRQREAAWAYVRMQGRKEDSVVKSRCRQAILGEADSRERSTTRSGFRYAKYDWAPGMWGAFTSPDGVSLARAHFLTGDD